MGAVDTGVMRSWAKDVELWPPAETMVTKQMELPSSGVIWTVVVLLPAGIVAVKLQ